MQEFESGMVRLPGEGRACEAVRIHHACGRRDSGLPADDIGSAATAARAKLRYPIRTLSLAMRQTRNGCVREDGGLTGYGVNFTAAPPISSTGFAMVQTRAIVRSS